MKLAIIIPASNRTELFEQTISTLESTLKGVDYKIYTKNGMGFGEIDTVNHLACNIGRNYEYLLRSDDDMFYKKGWLREMMKVLKNPDIKLVGGCYYPLHKILKKEKNYMITEIAPGNCWLMKKETWDKFEPIRDGMVQEDVDFCQRIQGAGYKVAVLKNPNYVVHCGITNARGRGRGEFVTRYMLDLIKKAGAIYA